LGEAARRVREGLKEKKPKPVEPKAPKRPKPAETKAPKRPKPVEHAFKDVKKISTQGMDKSPMSGFDFKKKHAHNF